MAAISSEQIRAARAIIRWEQKDLAGSSGVSLPTIKRLESQPGPLVANFTTIQALQAALERAGVEFIAENGGGAGVRLRKGAGLSAKQGPVDAPLVRMGRRMKADNEQSE